LLVNAQTVERTLAVCAGAHTFTEVLGRAKRVIQDAMEHADVPFARVVEAARVPRSTAYTPVFQTMMTLQGAFNSTRKGDAAMRLAGLKLEDWAVRVKQHGHSFCRMCLSGAAVLAQMPCQRAS